MINFRYHLVSLVAVFLALAIGVIVGTALLDNTVVDRLQSQQHTLDGKVADVTGKSQDLRQQLDELGKVNERLAAEGMARLHDVPVLVVGVRGADTSGLDGLRDRVGTAGARLLGTIWLTDHWTLGSADEVDELRAVVGADSTAPGQVRAEAITALAAALRAGVQPNLSESSVLLAALQKAGFIEFDAPQGQPNDLPAVDGSARLVLLGGPSAHVPDRQLSLPLARALIAVRSDRAPAALVVVESTADPVGGQKAPADQLLLPLRQDDVVSRALSTVDDLDRDSGQVAAILALADLGDSRYGHYGRADGASDLLPAPPPRPRP
jgi:hypothetical protein